MTFGKIRVLSNKVIFETHGGSLKSFRPNKDTRDFSENFFNFQHSLIVTLHTSPSNAPISVTRPNSTRRFLCKIVVHEGD